MKKILSIAMLLLMSLVVANAQEKDVTQFLGIPVDGTKTEMIKKLEAKGFQYNRTLDMLEGEFNGRDVYISVVTNNNKVWRIHILDEIPIDEEGIRLRFNELCYQFNKNRKYVSALEESYMIPKDEDISYEISINNKRYQASFLQRPIDSDLDDDDLRTAYFFSVYKKVVWFMIGEFYGKYRIAMYYDNKYNEADGEDL